MDFVCRRRAKGRLLGAAMIAMAVLPLAATAPARAQNLLEAMFGVDPRHQPPRAYSSPPPTMDRYSPRNHTPRHHAAPERPAPRAARGDATREHAARAYVGRGKAFCVRVCDGRFFPLQRHARISPVELCKSLCPASRTLVFYGGSIERAAGPGGTRYAGLENAFTYRKKLVPNCTCNGKDALGLARLSTASDLTLRPGDIVANEDGLMNFRAHKAKTLEFTPINPSSSAWAQKLSEIKVRPARPPSPIGIVQLDHDTEVSLRKELRRAQSAN